MLRLYLRATANHTGGCFVQADKAYAHLIIHHGKQFKILALMPFGKGLDQHFIYSIGRHSCIRGIVQYAFVIIADRMQGNYCVFPFAVLIEEMSITRIEVHAES